MIADYKLYQGAVLAQLIDDAAEGVTVRELVEGGRLHSYILNERIGLHIKHSAARLPPWQFTFTAANCVSLMQLRQEYKQVFVVLVCWLDGMVCLSIDEILEITEEEQPLQGWVRAERGKNEWYTISGPRAVLPYKKPQGLASLAQALDLSRIRCGLGTKLWRRMFG